MNLRVLVCDACEARCELKPGADTPRSWQRLEVTFNGDRIERADVCPACVSKALVLMSEFRVALSPKGPTK